MDIDDRPGTGEAYRKGVTDGTSEGRRQGLLLGAGATLILCLIAAVFIKNTNFN
ncbi:MAG: hypothetical protein AAB439_01250 [Patescibacteria group bacterium]